MHLIYTMFYAIIQLDALRSEPECRGCAANSMEQVDENAVWAEGRSS